jgi:TRAP-type C4-dicarboxylate transport system permease small subunit
VDKEKTGGNIVLTIIRKLNDWAVIADLLAITTIVIMQVFFRYVLQNPLRWTEEAARYLLIWLVLLGSGVAMRNHSHLQVDILTASLPEGPSRVLDAIVTVLTSIFLGIVVVYGVQLTFNNMRQLSPALKLPMGIVYAALPIGGALTLLECICAFINKLQKKKSA